MRAIGLGIMAIGLLLAGCAEQISSDVTRFNQLTLAPQGETVAVVAADKNLEKSMEFGQYAARLQEKLMAQGYRMPVAGTLPDIMAELDYGVTPGPAGLRDSQRSPVSVGVGMSGGSGGWHGGGVGVGVSTGFGLGGSSDGDAVFTRRLGLVMTRTRDNMRVFEGRVVSTGGTADLGQVMPYLMNALFTDFPGKNGETRKIEQPLKSAN
ncbi:DUF4136 domain-containing protein [Govanella unica]|uniref:DUF4136 domain-containing protein n=1 Tax=Govanella unica TaxID=2975056 RepID=A0A9X3Z6Y7_9PROT|nr:DUF4136 domain-containing protein [Govania unica]MDA5193414.1 DUF4136 domain-containing protein [Govania unica]